MRGPEGGRSRAAAPMSACCRCSWSEPRRRRRISRPGLADEITTALARFRWMFVVVQQLAGAVRGGDARRGVRSGGPSASTILLDGTIQRTRNRLRITIRLLDLRAGNQVVWARRFDRQAHDLLSLQDEIAAEVVAQIDPEILLIEAKRIAAQPPATPTAYDLVLRAMPLIGRMEKTPFMKAGDFLRQAIAIGAGLCRGARLVRLLVHLPSWPGLGG